MNQTELNQRTRDLLVRIRCRSKFLSIYDMPADLAEAAVWEIGRTLLESQRLRMVEQNAYRWYLRELSRLLRTKTDWDLALELEICLRKWAGYKLDPELLQVLLCECYDHIAVMTPDQIEIGHESTTKTQRHYLRQVTNDEVEMTNETRSPNAPNDGRRTMNEVAVLGGGNG